MENDSFKKDLLNLLQKQRSCNCNPLLADEEIEDAVTEEDSGRNAIGNLIKSTKVFAPFISSSLESFHFHFVCRNRMTSVVYAIKTETLFKVFT